MRKCANENLSYYQCEMQAAYFGHLLVRAVGHHQRSDYPFQSVLGIIYYYQLAVVYKYQILYTDTLVLLQDSRYNTFLSYTNQGAYFTVTSSHPKALIDFRGCSSHIEIWWFVQLLENE